MYNTADHGRLSGTAVCYEMLLDSYIGLFGTENVDIGPFEPCF